MLQDNSKTVVWDEDSMNEHDYFKYGAYMTLT